MAFTSVNWCVILKEYADLNKCTVLYETISRGPCHNPRFDAKVKLSCDDNLEARGTGNTKTAANLQAAQVLVGLLKEVDDTGSGHSENFIGQLQVSYPLLSYVISVYKNLGCVTPTHSLCCSRNYVRRTNGLYRHTLTRERIQLACTSAVVVSPLSWRTAKATYA